MLVISKDYQIMVTLTETRKVVVLLSQANQNIVEYYPLTEFRNSKTTSFQELLRFFDMYEKFWEQG